MSAPPTRIISFANQKGGVGKSTICLQEAFYLTEKLHKRVLVIDMDGQGNTSSRLAPKVQGESGDLEPVFEGTRTAELFAPMKPSSIRPMRCPCGADLIHSEVNDSGLFEMEAIPLDQAMMPARNLESILSQYDFVLIDCPPSLGRKLVAALAMSTHVVCPVKLSGFAVDGVQGLLETIVGVRSEYNPDLAIIGILINDQDRSLAHERALAQLTEAVPELILTNKLMHRSPIDTATTDGIPVWSLNYGHVAAAEMIAVLNEINEKVLARAA